MKIPWVPITSGDGVITPTNDKKWAETFLTAMNPVSHKAFQNLPMNTEASAVKVVEVNPKGRYGSTKIREHGEGAGENYVDSFVTHPIAGNYAAIVATLENQRRETQAGIMEARSQPISLAQVAEWGYRNLGENADEEKMNSLRDRLRFAGASDEEIESILKESKKESLMAAIKRPLSEEQRQVLAAERAAEAMIGRGAIMAGRMQPNVARPPSDTNVFDFSNAGPPGYVAFNTSSQPGNAIFAGARSGGINYAGKPSSSSSERDGGARSAYATAAAERRAERKVAESSESEYSVQDMAAMAATGAMPKRRGRPKGARDVRPTGARSRPRGSYPATVSGQLKLAASGTGEGGKK